MNFIDWGLIEYEKALNWQVDLVEKVIAQPELETIIFCSHPSVVTLGKKSEPADFLGWQGPVFHCQRGGRATYHGPGQVVAYPILHLSFRKNDLYLHLRQIEKSVVQTLAEWGVKAKTSEEHALEANETNGSFDKSLTGVWVNHQKIASIGIAVKRWVSYHGVAINLDYDPLAFQGISPCGYSASTMVSLEELLKQKIAKVDFQKILQKYFLVNLK